MRRILTLRQFPEKVRRTYESIGGAEYRKSDYDQLVTEEIINENELILVEIDDQENGSYYIGQFNRDKK
jgi:hypothetical protein